MYAAYGGQQIGPFPWKGPCLVNSQNKPLANFFMVDQVNIYKDKQSGELKIRKNIVSSGKLNRNKGDIITGNCPLNVNEFWKNDYGLFSMSGNVAEMLSENGRTKGGSWNSTGYYLQIEAEDEYAGFSAPSTFIGFRPIVVIKKKAGV